MDYGKWKYKQKKKEQKTHAAHVTQLKELRIKSVRIDDHDQTTKLNQAKKFLEEGHKVQFNIMFRGREMQHVDLGRNLRWNASKPTPPNSPKPGTLRNPNSKANA